MRRRTGGTAAAGRRRWFAALGVLVVGALACGGEGSGTVPGDADDPLAAAGTAQGVDPALVDEAVGTRVVDGAELYVREFGVGDPLLVIHGGPGMEHSYLVPGLDVLQQHARLVLYDQRGTGRSGGEVDPTSITLERFLQDVDGVRASTGLERIDILAHSFGGLLGVLYAARFPERVRSLVLVNSVEPGSRFAPETQARQQERVGPEIAAALDSLTRTDAFQRRDTTVVSEVYWTSLRATFADPGRADRLRITFTRQTAENGGTVASFLMGPLGDYDFWGELAAITAPTLIVQGAEDLIAPSVAEALASSVADGRLVLIEDAGHFPFLEQPEAFRSAVTEFLESVAGGVSP